MSTNRADRAAQVATERRRRDDLNELPRLKLAIPDEVRAKLAAEGRTPRWVNDRGSRVADLTNRDDYDPVDGVEPVKVDTDVDGKPVYARLFSKRNDFIEDDRKKADARRREVEAGMVKGKLPGQAGGEGQQIQGQMGAPVYVDEATKIGRANQVLE
jgi:hypothetical protein